MKPLITLLAATATLVATAQVTHDLHVMNDQFNPALMTISLGDHVHIIWDAPNHSFTQVDEATWNANGTTSNGGFNFGLGTPDPGTDFTITPTAEGTIFYVCTFHVSMGMKGRIVVQGTNGVEEPVAQADYNFAPNPARTTLQIIAPDDAPVMVELFDATGKQWSGKELGVERQLDLDAVPAGSYIVSIRTLNGQLLARRTLMVVK